jgi:hypothetical protein
MCAVHSISQARGGHRIPSWDSVPYHERLPVVSEWLDRDLHKEIKEDHSGDAYEVLDRLIKMLVPDPESRPRARGIRQLFLSLPAGSPFKAR